MTLELSIRAKAAEADEKHKHAERIRRERRELQIKRDAAQVFQTNGLDVDAQDLEVEEVVCGSLRDLPREAGILTDSEGLRLAAWIQAGTYRLAVQHSSDSGWVAAANLVKVHEILGRYAT